MLEDIACPAAQPCWIAGSHGTIARITGGSTVTAEPVPTTADLDGIACVGEAACYAVGDGGTILARR